MIVLGVSLHHRACDQSAGMSLINAVSPLASNRSFVAVMDTELPLGFLSMSRAERQYQRPLRWGMGCPAHRRQTRLPAWQ